VSGKLQPLMVTAGLLLLASPAAAQLVDSPRAMGMGGAVRGDPVANSALVYNPAGMARAIVYSAQGQFFRSGAGELNAAGVSVVDSKTQPRLAMGAAYGYVFSDAGAPVETKGHDVRLGFASPLDPQNSLSMGLTLHYIHLDRTELDDFKRLTADVGLLWSPSGMLHLGLVGHNLIKTDNPELPRQAGAGIGITSGLIALDLDVLADFDTAEDTKAVVHGGLELLLAEIIPLRMGFIYDKARDRTLATGGLGLLGGGADAAGFQINLAYQQDVSNSDDFVMSAGATFFL
jgi:hypothetical protein